MLRDISKPLFKKPERYFKAYSFPDNIELGVSSFENSMSKLTGSIMTQIVDMADQSIVDAIVKTAQEEGVTYLYLIDKKFIMEAIQEKLERM